MSTSSNTAMICPSCGKVTYFNEISLYFKSGKLTCQHCGYEFKSDRSALEEQVALHLKQFTFLHAVAFYNKASGAGLAESKKEVERIARANGIEVPKSKCFIATAAYGTAYRDEVVILQIFRDNVLLKSFAGKLFVKSYYLLSPPAARAIAGSELLKDITRKYFIAPLTGFVRKYYVK